MKYSWATTKDYAQIKTLWETCFPDQQQITDSFFTNYFPQAQTFCLFQQQQLISNVQIYHFNCQLRKHAFPIAYLVGVATDVNFRGHHYASALMQETFQQLSQQNIPIAMLTAVYPPLYQKDSFAFCSKQYRYNLFQEDLQRIAQPWGQWDKINPQTHLQDLAYIYQTMTADKNHLLRNERSWQQLLTEHQIEGGYTYLLTINNQPRAYLLFYQNKQQLEIREIGYSNIQALSSAYHFILQQPNISQLLYPAPSWDSTYEYLAHYHEPTLVPFAMARIINLQEVLKNIQYPTINCSLIIEVTDQQIHSNNITLQLTIVQGQVNIEEIQQQAEVSLDITDLTQLVFGYKNAYQLLEQTTSNSELLAALNSIFPACDTFINQYRL